MHHLPVFPIKPTFISKLKSCVNPEDCDNLNNIGIFDNDIIEGFLAITSREMVVKLPTVLFEFIPKSIEIPKELQSKTELQNVDNLILEILDGKRIIRTDIQQHRKLRGCCTCFRKLLNTASKPEKIHCNCYQIDSRVGIFAKEGLVKNNLSAQLGDIIEKINKNEKSDLEINKFNGREYLIYTCPFSLFNELVFPLFFEESVVGCLMVGQFIPELFNIENSLNSYINSLNDDGIELTIDEKDELEKKLKSEFNKEKIRNTKLEESKFYNHNTKLDQLLHSVIDHISNFEESLNNRINLHRQRFILKKFNSIKLTFQEDCGGIERNGIIKSDVQIINELSKIIETSFGRIITEFEVKEGFFRLFGVKEFDQPDHLSLLSASDRNEIIKETENYWYDLTVLKDIDKNKQINNTEFPVLNEGIRLNDIQIKVKEKEIVRFYPTLASNISFIFWKKYEYSEDNNEQGIFFKNALMDLYSYYTATYAYIWGSINEKNLENSLRIIGHESIQIIKVIKNSIKRNFENIHQLIINIRDFRNNYYKRIEDLKNYLDLLQFVMERPSFLFKRKDLNLKDTNINEVIIKLRNFYNEELKHKNLSYEFEKDPNGISIIKADEILIEHTLNNLIDNAVKYSHRGTKIIVRIKSDKANILIHVISFGIKVKSKEIYNLYHRGTLVHHGYGIGLYLCKNIVNAHGGIIDNSCEEICNFHLGCLAYFNEVNSGLYNSISEDELRILKDNYDMCYQNGFIKDFVAKDIKDFKEYLLYKPGPIEFSAEYKNATYKNDFYFKLPI